MNEVGRGNWTDFFPDPVDQLGFQILITRQSGIQSDIAINALPFNIVRIADHGGFRHLAMRHQRAFDLCRAEPVAGNIQHIIDAAGNPIKAVFVAAAAIAGEISARILREISFDKALMVAIDGAHLPGPAIGNA